MGNKAPYTEAVFVPQSAMWPPDPFSWWPVIVAVLVIVLSLYI